MAAGPNASLEQDTSYQGPDRRRSPRRDLQAVVRELRPNQASRRMVSMSTSGMYIRTSVPYLSGTLAVFEIQLGSKASVVVPAWVVRGDEHTGMAFEFMAPELDLAEALEA